jgi:membrane protein implicated in regulation of membrane protease activity
MLEYPLVTGVAEEGSNMSEFFESLVVTEKIFFASAVVGGVGMVIRLVLQLVGGFDADADVDIGDVDVGDLEVDVDTDISASDASFHLLSLQGIMGFFLMFGLVGLALMKQTGMSAGVSILGGFCAGMVSLWVVAKMFAWMKSLQSSGTLNLKNAIGNEGKVYLTVPASGVGKVEVVVQGRLKIFEAVSDGEQEIKTGEAVKVINVQGGNMMVVTKV